MKDLRAKNVDLAQRLETALYYGDAIRVEMAKVEDAEIKRVEAESKLDKAKAVAKQLQKDLHETECQVATFTRQLDYANEHHHKEASDSSKKENRELK